MWETLTNYNWENLFSVLPGALVFYVLAGLAILFGILVVANPFSRSPINSALSLLATVLALAGLSVLLHAYFLAAVQVIIYAGAVLVLFIFVLMLSRKEMKIVFPSTRVRYAVGAVVALSLACLLLSVVFQMPAAAPVKEAVDGTVPAIGKLLVTEYLVPFEAISVLLLAAIVGVVHLSKPNTKGESK
ncbi:MAG TPA: NADH-quinone oxidoreductase subunit J [Verrucomicrobiota bacterium]|jgi:NADH-quinone oxidoreductase subunit J|nr:NADH-quinone oxidoreductase subunit J [Verrucomicrobiota bacterium]